MVIIKEAKNNNISVNRKELEELLAIANAGFNSLRKNLGYNNVTSGGLNALHDIEKQIEEWLKS